LERPPHRAVKLLAGYFERVTFWLGWNQKT
jgi:hypothetical protein